MYYEYIFLIRVLNFFVVQWHFLLLRTRTRGLMRGIIETLQDIAVGIQISARPCHNSIALKEGDPLSMQRHT